MNNSESEIRIIDMSAQQEEKAPKKPVPLTHSMVAKIVAFFVLIVMSVTVALCAISAVIMTGLEMYTTPEAVFMYEAFESIAREDGEELVPCVLYENEHLAERYCENSSIGTIVITDAETGEELWSWSNNYFSDSEDVPTDILFTWYEYSGSWNGDAYIQEVSRAIDVQMNIMLDYEIQDDYYLAYELIEYAYGMLYWVYVIGSIALILAIVCFVFLMCSAGHRRGYEEVRAGWGTKIPFDLLTAVLGVFGFFAVWLMILIMDEIAYTGLLMIPVAAVVGAVAEAALVGWFMSLATRIKLGKWWQNTVVYYLLRLLWKFVKYVGRQLKRFFHYMRNLPLIWKTVGGIVGLTVLEFIIILCCWWEPDNLISFWLVEKLVLIPIVIKNFVSLKKLQKAGEALSEGDLSYQVDTEKMWGDFKQHGEALNSIAEGMALAVEEQMKSERMKTELITNVSHDIKTPLTSIINYTDLISKESCDNPKITEYSEVLMRSSERLKRLIEDLVEASKASTGNLEVFLAPCNANILLTQAVGEYEGKLRAQNLELITTQPDESVMIMADGRRLWRVFDNLINNVSKYAQRFTRVYFSLEQTKGEAVITLKNTSSSPLNISADELMERFVRGDESRNTEGNGLGLSIARSLTELQGGTLELSIDGDLFKVTLRFPVIK